MSKQAHITTAEIQERHDWLESNTENTNAYSHTDRGILLKRLAEAEANFKEVDDACKKRGDRIIKLKAKRATLAKVEYRLKMLHYKTGIHESELDEFIIEAEL